MITIPIEIWQIISETITFLDQLNLKATCKHLQNKPLHKINQCESKDLFKKTKTYLFKKNVSSDDIIKYSIVNNIMDITKIINITRMISKERKFRKNNCPGHELYHCDDYNVYCRLCKTKYNCRTCYSNLIPKKHSYNSWFTTKIEICWSCNNRVSVVNCTECKNPHCRCGCPCGCVC